MPTPQPRAPYVTTTPRVVVPITPAPAPAQKKGLVEALLRWMVEHPWQSVSIALAVVSFAALRKIRSEQHELSEIVLSVEKARLDALRRLG